MYFFNRDICLIQAKVTSKDMAPVISNTVSAIKETSNSAKDKKPASSSFASIDAAQINFSSMAPASITVLRFRKCQFLEILLLLDNMSHL